MAGEPKVQVSKLLDECGLSSFHIKLIVWSVLIAVIDGYDLAVTAYVAPHLVTDWGVPRGSLGPVLSASGFGVLIGSQIFGWLGDNFGRKPALIAANLFFGIVTFATAYSTNLTELFWLRVIAGLGIGGVIPNVVALNGESAARRLRTTLAIIAVGLVPLGGAGGGIVSAAFVPQYGWPILFKIGGAVPIVIALAAVFGLPESIKYMALHETHRRKMEQLIAVLRPDFKIPPNARFVIEDEKQSPSSNPIYLFRDGLALITPLTWLMFILNLMGFYFLGTWTPTLMSAAHVPPATAALAGSALQIGGTVGALTLCRWLQRWGFSALAIMFVLAMPVVGSIGFAGMTSPAALLTATFFAGFFVLGIQTGINVLGAMIYPTSLRANGSGWQLGLGRLGAIAGPLLGGVFAGLPVEQLYLWSMLPFAVGAVVCFVIYLLLDARQRARPNTEFSTAA